MRYLRIELASVVAAGAWAVASPVGAAIINVDADTYIRDATPRGGATFVDTRGFAGADFVAYIRFDLSSLNIDTITSATLSLHKVAGSRNDGITTGRFEVQGLTNTAGNTAQNWDEATLSTDSVGLEYNTVADNSVDLARVVNLDADDGASVTESVAEGPAATTLTGADLLAFLNSRADDNGLVTFIISLNANNDRGYGFASRENADTTLLPTLDIEFTAVPEPVSFVLASLAGLAFLGRRHA